jgi:hypothetical protein
MQQRESSGTGGPEYPEAPGRSGLEAEVAKVAAYWAVQDAGALWTLEPSTTLLEPGKPDEIVTKRRSSLRRRREDPAEAVLKEPQVYLSHLFLYLFIAAVFFFFFFFIWLLPASFSSR